MFLVPFSLLYLLTALPSDPAVLMALEVYSPFHARLDNARLELCRRLHLAAKRLFRNEKDELENTAAMVLQCEKIYIYGGYLRYFAAAQSQQSSRSRVWIFLSKRFALVFG